MLGFFYAHHHQGPRDPELTSFSAVAEKHFERGDFRNRLIHIFI